MGRPVGTVRPEGWPAPGSGLRSRAIAGSLAPEGATAATDWAFDNLGWTDVIHSIAPANIASQQVARKLGSRNR
jgi:hypothetical protein